MILIDKLKKQSDFDKIFRNGKRVFTKSLTFLYIPSDVTKIGYCVSKKHGKAVVRNRIKRLLRAAVRKNECFLTGNVKAVLLPKVKENGDYSFKEYEEDIKAAFKKIEK